MKTQTRALAVTVACITLLAAAALAFGAQKPKLDPPVFTIKSNGKAVAVITMLESDSSLLITSDGFSTFRGPSIDVMTHGTFKGKVTIQRKGDAQPLVVVNADEVQMVMGPSK